MNRQKGEKYRPVVEVLKEKEGKPTEIQVSGTVYVDAEEYEALKRMYAQTASKLKKVREAQQKTNNELDRMRRGNNHATSVI